jgi:hypothetical protein
MNLDKGLKRKQKKGKGKSFFLYFTLFHFSSFFSRQNVEVCVVKGDVYCAVRGSVSEPTSGALCWWALSGTAAECRTSEYFNCANSSSCTVSELVMCIKPSAERCLLLEGFVFVFYPTLFLSFVFLSVRILALVNSGGKTVVNSFLLSTALSLIFYLSCIFCCVLLFLFKIIFH